MTQRYTYDQIRYGKFLTMYEARREIVRQKRSWTHPIEDVGVAYDDPDYSSFGDLHTLMSKTIDLILSAGLMPEQGVMMVTNEINEILAAHSIDELLHDIPEAEARELRIDLEYLGFIPPEITKPLYT